MSTDRSNLTNPRRRLPDLSLPALATGAPTPLRASSRRAPVLILVHGHACQPCRGYLHSLAPHRKEILEWDGQLLVVCEDTSGAAGYLHDSDPPLPMLVDPERRLASALSVEAPATVVADQWGEIHETKEGGSAHHFLSPAELVQWVRYLAIQCPECQAEAY